MRKEKGSSLMKLLVSEVPALHHGNNQIIVSVGQTIYIVYAR